MSSKIEDPVFHEVKVPSAPELVNVRLQMRSFDGTLQTVELNEIPRAWWQQHFGEPFDMAFAVTAERKARQS